MIHSNTTGNSRSPAYLMNRVAGLSGMQEPPSGSRLNCIPGPEVHEAYPGFVHNLRSCS
jgi:hypothetical protein